jgi:4-hydroxybenzoate polyprenyltransferase
MEKIAPEEARASLDAVARAEQQVADEVGLPRTYWWGMAAGWVAFGVLADRAPAWLLIVATVLFGVGHSILASRLLDGRRRTGQVRPSRAAAGRRTPIVVVAMLLGLVATTVGAALALDADGAAHPSIWAALLVGSVVGFGGQEILRALRRAFRT